MFSALTEDDKLKDKINIFIALAPIAKIGRVDDNTYFAVMSRRIPLMLQYTYKWGVHEFFNENWFEFQEKLSLYISDDLKNAIKV